MPPQTEAPAIKPIYLRLPPEIQAEADRRAASESISVQHLITQTLATAWELPQPELRTKGRPKKPQADDRVSTPAENTISGFA